MQVGSSQSWGPPEPIINALPNPRTLSAPPAAARWPAARIAAVEALWGPGYTSPGGPQETQRLVKPIGLDQSGTLLLLGGGLGGPAESIVDKCGAWIESFEADGELATIAEKRRHTLAAGKRIKVASWDRAAPAFRRRSANHALSLEALRGAPLTPMLDGVTEALRPHGHIVMTELVAEKPAPPGDREFAAWCRLENRLPNLPSSDAVTTELARHHFDVRVVEDMSDRHVTATLAGWRAAVKTMSTGPKPDPASAGVFVTEAELWLLRVRLMRRFGFKLLRWHAIGTA